MSLWQYSTTRNSNQNSNEPSLCKGNASTRHRAHAKHGKPVNKVPPCRDDMEQAYDIEPMHRMVSQSKCLLADANKVWSKHST